MSRFTVLGASPDPDSAFTQATRHAAQVLAENSGLDQPHIVDLAELSPLLLSADPPEAVRAARDAVAASEVVMVASPQVHGSYTGLLKVFLDQLPELALAHAVAVPLAAVADLGSGRGIEEDLRLLLSELGAWVPEPALLLSRPELHTPAAVVAAWAEIVAPQVREALAVRA
ncbi:NAD(P)H-dependent oxidoreductase [Lipingzhangella sp. LS1_29]|uniref:NAD(P)H-dependent oxidoreductase n=1 Tax=Lipingzhangella rawalii TaxID=2055835 RepID=A0ABU2HA78_9ACTN|nr:NAD(P)H-dependent oxidoreductase [Lipingzhangella rawalii]MDS1272213.1 NAD(P)H-dependent oxidoreductase [Lipingzhangella rawalii]